MRTSFKCKFNKKKNALSTPQDFFIADKVSFNIYDSQKSKKGRTLKNEKATRTWVNKDENGLYHRPPDEEPLVAAVAEPLIEPPVTEGESERPWKESDAEMETPV